MSTMLRCFVRPSRSCRCCLSARCARTISYSVRLGAVTCGSASQSASRRLSLKNRRTRCTTGGTLARSAGYGGGLCFQCRKCFWQNSFCVVRFSLLLNVESLTAGGRGVTGNVASVASIHLTSTECVSHFKPDLFDRFITLVRTRCKSEWGFSPQRRLIIRVPTQETEGLVLTYAACRKEILALRVPLALKLVRGGGDCAADSNTTSLVGSWNTS